MYLYFEFRFSKFVFKHNFIFKFLFTVQDASEGHAVQAPASQLETERAGFTALPASSMWFYVHLMAVRGTESP